MPTFLFAAITLDFDPFVRLGDSGVRLDTIALAAVIVVALAFTAIVAGRTGVHDPLVPAWAAAADLHLRRDDLLFIVLGVIPGAVLGGRMGYVLIHLDYYTANPSAILDPNQGSLELGLAVLIGTITGAYVGRLLEAPVGRWLHVAAIPLLVAIGLGELSRILGGGGQGSATDAPWAVAYAGPGPWETLVPGTPAHPAQLYGALAALLAVAVVSILRRLGGFRTRDGSAFFVGVLVWALGRSLATFAWRDDAVLGPLRAGALIALGVAIAALVGLLVARFVATRSHRQAHGHSAGHAPDAGGHAEAAPARRAGALPTPTARPTSTAPPAPPAPDWPDPGSRPRF